MTALSVASEPVICTASDEMSFACPYELASGEVHCWCARLDVPPETSARLYAALSVDERRRCARFRFERDRRHFIVAHGVLRDLLGRYLRIPPGRIRYVFNAFGKPDLHPEFGGRLEFNLSHSGGLVLIAFVTQSSIGVDVEHVRADSDEAEVAKHFFSAAEIEALDALPSHRYAAAFMGCWTKKEAYLKARGGGLAIPMNSFDVPIETDPTRAPEELLLASNDTGQSTRWSFHALRPEPGYVGAVVIDGTGWRLTRRRWNACRIMKPTAHPMVS